MTRKCKRISTFLLQGLCLSSWCVFVIWLSSLRHVVGGGLLSKFHRNKLPLSSQFEMSQVFLPLVSLSPPSSNRITRYRSPSSVICILQKRLTSSLKKEALYFFEILVTLCRTTLCHVPEDSSVNSGHILSRQHLTTN